MNHLTEMGKGHFRIIALFFFLTVDCGAYKTEGRKTTKNTVLIFLIIEQFQKSSCMEFPFLQIIP